MMKFDLFFILSGPAKTIKAPNAENPVEAESLGALLETLSHPDNLPTPMGCPCVGVEVRPHGVEIHDV